MLIVGLTGGIATGKSTASRAFQAQGVPVIDADIIAHQIMEPGGVSYKLVVKHFGADILQMDTKAIDRAKLGSIIFNDPAKRQLLNQCTHPYVRRRILYQVFKCYIQGYAMCILDIPLLFESGLDRMCNKVAVISCTAERQLARLMNRNGLSRQEAEARIKSQMPMDEKERRATRVINNNGSIEEMEKQIRKAVVEWRPSVIRTIGSLVASVGLIASLPFARTSMFGLGTLCACTAWILGSVFGS
ncbi:Dephospho-CoA kinase [Coemansia spiralis]|uniref:Dephospho-CoA kinase n=2 Tax=Coemansia TaxID=4863 RepID=A0A9W8G3J1_9FUNG|nr:Dephospho-CoA kinase [Coemansia umbellata]KAJ2624420.1 Dephospho-CoA kinase [Coemansia sp. RSA 1358]KAJ2671092.1 Dephospho-CoA kinase [Coemansia spiralis]